MKINISGSINLGQSFPAYVEEKFEKEVTKLFENIPGIEVKLSKEGPMISTAIVSNDVTSKGSKITANAEGKDAYESFNEAFKKFITQLRKEKGKLESQKKQG